MTRMEDKKGTFLGELQEYELWLGLIPALGLSMQEEEERSEIAKETSAKRESFTDIFYRCWYETFPPPDFNPQMPHRKNFRGLHGGKLKTALKGNDESFFQNYQNYFPKSIFPESSRKRGSLWIKIATFFNLPIVPNKGGHIRGFSGEGNWKVKLNQAFCNWIEYGHGRWHDFDSEKDKEGARYVFFRWVMPIVKGVFYTIFRPLVIIASTAVNLAKLLTEFPLKLAKDSLSALAAYCSDRAKASESKPKKVLWYAAAATAGIFSTLAHIVHLPVRAVWSPMESFRAVMAWTDTLKHKPTKYALRATGIISTIGTTITSYILLPVVAKLSLMRYAPTIAKSVVAVAGKVSQWPVVKWIVHGINFIAKAVTKYVVSAIFKNQHIVGASMKKSAQQAVEHGHHVIKTATAGVKHVAKKTHHLFSRIGRGFKNIANKLHHSIKGTGHVTQPLTSTKPTPAIKPNHSVPSKQPVNLNRMKSPKKPSATTTKQVEQWRLNKVNLQGRNTPVSQHGLFKSAQSNQIPMTNTDLLETPVSGIFLPLAPTRAVLAKGIPNTVYKNKLQN